MGMAMSGDSSRSLTTTTGKRLERPEGLLEVLRKAVVDHQLGLSINMLALPALTYTMFPSLRRTTSAFFTLSYPTEHSGMYGQGSRDLYLVAFFVVLFTALRAATMDYALIPLAETCGVTKSKAKIRCVIIH